MKKGPLSPVGSDDSDGVWRGAVAAGDVLLAGGAGVGEEGLGGQGRRRGRGAAGGDVQDAAADTGVLGRRDLVRARAQQLRARVLLQVPRQVRLEHAELLLFLLVVVGSGGGRHLGLCVAAAAPAAAPAATVARGGGHGGGPPVGGAASHVRRRGVRGLLQEAGLVRSAACRLPLPAGLTPFCASGPRVPGGGGACEKGALSALESLSLAFLADPPVAPS